MRRNTQAVQVNSVLIPRSAVNFVDDLPQCDAYFTPVFFHCQEKSETTLKIFSRGLFFCGVLGKKLKFWPTTVDIRRGTITMMLSGTPNVFYSPEGTYPAARAGVGADLPAAAGQGKRDPFGQDAAVVKWSPEAKKYLEEQKKHSSNTQGQSGSDALKPLSEADQ